MNEVARFVLLSGPDCSEAVSDEYIYVQEMVGTSDNKILRPIQIFVILCIVSLSLKLWRIKCPSLN